MSGMSKLDELSQIAQPAAKKIKAQKFVRIVSHHDADGITACGVICQMLRRLNIPFQATIISNLDPSILNFLEPDQLVIFCDMGSGQPDLVNKFDAIILDHHIPQEGHTQVQINPHLIGMDGGSEVSAAGVCYALARLMGDNADLAGLAISGAIGDKQKMQGVNKDILEEGIKAKAITVQKGLKLGRGSLEKAPIYSIDPYFDFSGNPQETKKFLEELHIGGSIESLSHEELKKLSSALTLKLLRKSPPDTIDSLLGDAYILNCELIKDVYDFTNTVNSCGKLGAPGLGLAVCLRDESAMKEAESKRFEYSGQILNALSNAITNTHECGSLRYVDICCSDVTGAIASTIIRYVMPDKPIIVLNTENSSVKISARGTAELIEKGLDLSVAIRESAKLAGGNGGGHKIASGGMIPVGNEKVFLKAADAAIGRQLNGKV